MTNALIISYIDANIYNLVSPKVRGDVLKQALHNIATMDARVSGTFTDGLDSPTTGVLSIDFRNRTLSSQAGTIVLDYKAGGLLLKDSAGVTSQAWGGRTWYDNTGTIAGNYQQRKFADSSTFWSLDWANRALIDTAGTVQSLNWGTRSLINSSSVPTIDWQGSRLNDNAGTKSLDWDLGRAYEVTGANATIDYRSLLLGDATGVASLDWGNRRTKNNGGVTTIDWQLRQQMDAASAVSIDWGARTQSDAAGTIAHNWGTRLLKDSAGLNCISYDASSGNAFLQAAGTNSIDWATRILYDNVGAAMINFAIPNRFQIMAGKTIMYNTTFVPATVATTAGATPGQYYGGNTAFMGSPTGWIRIKDGAGTDRYMPYYT